MNRTFKTLFAFVAAILLAMPAVTLAQLTPGNTGLSAAAAGTGLASGCSGTECVVTIIANVINIVLGFLGVVLLLIVMYAGFKWMTADDKGDDVKKAKDMIKNAVAGLVVIAVSYAFAAFVIQTLGTLGNAETAPAVTTEPTSSGQPQ